MLPCVYKLLEGFSIKNKLKQNKLNNRKTVFLKDVCFSELKVEREIWPVYDEVMDTKNKRWFSYPQKNVMAVVAMV